MLVFAFEAHAVVPGNQIAYQLDHATLQPNGRRGSALQLGPAQSAVNLQQPLSSREGTIAFWIQPAWARPRTAVQPLLSLAWPAAPASYLIISQGWWEPTGGSRLYFVVSNRELLHCSVKQELDDRTWTLITAVWRDNSCALFLDGVRVADGSVPGRRAEQQQSVVHLGTDAGAAGRAEHSAAAVMDDLQFFQSALSDQQVLELHEHLEGGRQNAIRHRWRWLQREARSAGGSSGGSAGELRAIFDESWQWAQSRAQIDRIVDRTARAGFNVIVPCVWHGAGTYYPSKLAPAAAPLAAVIDSGFDPLAYLVERAHAAGIQVYAWFTVARREQGLLPMFAGEGVPDGAFDVHDEAFRTFIVDLIVDAARRYPLDGINLDYIRAMGVCKSTRCAQQYRAASGRDLQADLAGSNVAGPARTALEEWQDSAVTDLVSRIRERTRAVRPGIVLSADGQPTPAGEVRPLQGRDEIQWAKLGLLDVIFHMDYRHTLDLQVIDAVVAELPASTRYVLLVANYDRIGGVAYARPGWVMADLVRLVRRRWPQAGVGMHLEAMLNDEQVDALRTGPYRSKARQ